MGRQSEVQSFSYNTTGVQKVFTAPEPGLRLFQISGTWTTLSMQIQGSILGVTWVTIETGIAAAAGYINIAPWPLYRVNIVTLTGVGATVILDFLVEKQLRLS